MRIKGPFIRLISKFVSFLFHLSHLRSSFFFPGPVKFSDLNDDQINHLVKLDPVTKKHVCEICKRQCASKQKAVEHVRCKHVGRKDFMCLYCSRDFFTASARNLHIYSRHEEQHKLAKLLPS